MKHKIALILALFFTCLSQAQVIDQEQQIKEINLKLYNSGQALKSSASLDALSIGAVIVGSGIAAFSVYSGSNEGILIGSVISILSVPISMGSISQKFKASKIMMGEIELEEKDPSKPKMSEKEIEELREKNRQYLKEQNRINQELNEKK